MNFRLSANTAVEIGQQVRRCFHSPKIAVNALKMLIKYHFFPGVGGMGSARRFPNFPLFYPYAVLMSVNYIHVNLGYK